jgi:hypothetical protein
MAAWRLWTQHGRYSAVSFSDVFSIDGKRISRNHIVAWALITFFLLMAFFGALSELTASV